MRNGTGEGPAFVPFVHISLKHLVLQPKLSREAADYVMSRPKKKEGVFVRRRGAWLTAACLDATRSRNSHMMTLVSFEATPERALHSLLEISCRQRVIGCSSNNTRSCHLTALMAADDPESHAQALLGET